MPPPGPGAGLQTQLGDEPLELTAMEREEWQSLARRPKTAQALAMRARMVLACADGLSNSEASRRLGVSLPTIGK